MNILLTGSAGFIGSHTAERLLREGHTVTGFDNFDPYYSVERKRRNTRTALEQHGSGLEPHYRLIEGDLEDADLLKNILRSKRFDLVIHLAAQAGVRPSIDDPQKYARVNVTGLINVLEAMRAGGVKRIVAASSSSVYGDVTPAPFREDAPCVMPQSPYAASKRAGEIYLGMYRQLHGLEAITVRPFTVYGPRQRPDMAISPFIQKIMTGQPITLYGDGSTSRAYTYVDDIVDGIMAATNFPVPYGIYNLGNDHTVTLAELVALIEKVTGKRAQIQRVAKQPGDAEKTSADLTFARRDLGFQPKISLEEGLRRTADWVKREML